MAEISGSSWSETDALNSSPAPNGFPEGMPFSGVNDSARAVMGAVKRFWGRINGRYASTGSSNAYVLTPDVALSAYVTGERYSFRANFANTGAATLNISSLGAKSIKKMTASGKADLAPGDIQQGQPVTVEYDGTDFVMVTPPSTVHAASLRINDLTEDTSPDISADYVPSYDASAGTNKKVPLSAIAAGPMFQCRLTKSGSDLLLSRCNGKYLFIDGVNREIPQAGVTLPPTGLSVGTNYYIYAWMDSGTMKLEASTTAPADDSAYGHKIKTGDPTRTLVGLAHVGGGTVWRDDDTARFVLSYFNRRAKPVVGANTNGATTTSTSIVELTTAARAYFLTWGDEAVSIGIAGYARNSSGVSDVIVVVGLDGLGFVGTSSIAQSPINNGPESHNARHTAYLSEDFHYVTPMGWVNSGSGTFYLQVHATVQG